MRHSFLSTFVPLFSLCIDIGSLTPHRFTSQFVYFFFLCSTRMDLTQFVVRICEYFLCLYVCVVWSPALWHTFSFFCCAVWWRLFRLHTYGLWFSAGLHTTKTIWNKITCYVSKLNYCHFFGAVKTSNILTRGIVREREAFLELNDQNAKTWKRTIESDERKKNENYK